MNVRKVTIAGLFVLVGVSGGDAFVAEASGAGGFFAYPAGPSAQFGEPGSGDGQLSAPAGVAVNEATGDVYVVDRGNDRVEVFDTEGKYLSQFNGSEAPTGQFSEPSNVAVDNASGPLKGAIFVIDPGHKVVDGFAPDGKYAAQLTGTCEKPEEPSSCPGSKLIPFSELAGAAVDATGNLWVYEGRENEERKGAINEFSATGSYVGQFNTFREAAPGLGLALDSSDDSYVLQGNGFISKFNAARARVGELDFTKTATALAADLVTNNVFVDRGGQIAKYGPFGEPLTAPVEAFGTEGLAESRGIAVDAATGTVYASEQQADMIAVFKESMPIAQATVNDQPPSVSSVTRTTVLVSGVVDPGSTSTTYAVEAVDDAEYLPAAANPYVNGSKSASLAAGESSGDVPVGPVALTGLLAGTTYHYRFLASNQTGTTYGPDHTFTTAPGTAPIVTTGAVSEVTQTGVLLSGTVDTRALQTSYEFEVGTDPASYNGAKLFGNAGHDGIEAVSVSLQFLIPGVTYHYRLVASNEDGTSYGQDVTFTTPGVSTPISQPPVLAMLSSPTGAFPQASGAIKPAVHKETKSKKKKHRSKHKKKTKSKKKK
jgi:hypothetical protein